jgi:hypothetical protein
LIRNVEYEIVVLEWIEWTDKDGIDELELESLDRLYALLQPFSDRSVSWRD